MKILVCCYGNTCRSPMMEAFLNEELQKAGITDYEIESAGLLQDQDGRPASANSRIVMRELGFDIEDHRSRFAGNLDLASFNHVFVTDSKLIKPLVNLGVKPEIIEVINGDGGGVPNPYEKGVIAYRIARDVMRIESVRIAEEL